MKINEGVWTGSVIDDNILYAVNNRLKERKITRNPEGKRRKQWLCHNKWLIFDEK